MYESLWSFPGGVLGEFDRLRRELDDVFGAATTGAPSSIRSAAPGAFPAINVGLTPSSVEVYAFAPGLDPAGVEVVIDRGVLTLSGQRPASLPQGEGKTSVYKQERTAGAFKRAISLPDDVDAAHVNATYRDGVLNVSIARRAEAQPKRITVQ